MGSGASAVVILVMMLYACDTRKEMKKYLEHEGKPLREVELEASENLEAKLDKAGLSFEILRKVKTDSLILHEELKAAGVNFAADRIELISAVQTNNLKAFNEVLGGSSV